MVARERLTGGNYFAAPKSKIEFISSGSYLLDLALGGGWAERRIANIIGDKSTGKTLECIEACANFAIKYESPKAKIRYRESESAFDKLYARALGMPVDRIDFGEPMDTVEDLFEDLEKIVEKSKGHPELVCVDSLDALSDRAEQDRDIDEGSYGAQKAKKMSELFRRLTSKMERANVTLIIVSQIRDKIGVTYGSKVSRTGGKALDFYASQVLMLAHIKRLMKNRRGLKRATGVRVLGRVEKNKIALPFREAEFDINFGYGVNDLQSCINWLKQVHSFKLKDYGLTDKQASDILPAHLDMSVKDESELRKLLHARVATEWYEIERSLMPKRSKYAA